MRDRLRRIEQAIRAEQPRHAREPWHPPEYGALAATEQPRHAREPWHPPEYGALAAIRDLRRYEQQPRMPLASVGLLDITEDAMMHVAADLNRLQAMWAFDRQRYMNDFHGAISAGFLPSDTDPEWLVPSATGY